MVNYKFTAVLLAIILVVGYKLDTITRLLEEYAFKLSPSHPDLAKFLIISLIVFLIFSEEINILYKKLSNSIKFKESF